MHKVVPDNSGPCAEVRKRVLIIFRKKSSERKSPFSGDQRRKRRFCPFLYLELYLKFIIFYSTERDFAYLKETGKVYNLLPKKAQVLLLQAASFFYSFAELDKANWSVDLSHFKSAKQLMKKNFHVIAPPGKPPRPPSKIGLKLFILCRIFSSIKKIRDDLL